MVREPLQLWNFGTVVDHIGGCGPAWSQAILSGAREAPAHAMADCGAPQALAYARGIDGTVFAIGLGYAVLGLCFAVFVSYASYSYLMVSGAAFLNAVLALVAAGPAMIHGAPRARAGRRLREFFRHAGYVFAYTLYISFTAVIILKTITPGGYAAQVGMTSPVAKLVLIALISVIATGLFWWMKKELGDNTFRSLRHSVTEAYRHTQRGYQRGQRTYERGRDVAGGARGRFGRSETGDADDAAGGSAAVTNPPVSGRPPAGKRTTSRSAGVVRQGYPVSDPAGTASPSRGTDPPSVRLRDLGADDPLTAEPKEIRLYKLTMIDEIGHIASTHRGARRHDGGYSYHITPAGSMPLTVADLHRTERCKRRPTPGPSGRKNPRCR